MTESLISDEPRRAIAARPHTATGAAAAPTRTLLDVFAATLARCPERPAIDADARTVTYAELWRLAGALADRLAQLGAGPGDRVGVRIPSGTVELYAAILGILRSGAAYVPVDAEDPPARVETIWEEAGVCAVVQAGLEIAPRATPGGDPRPPQADDDAWVIFTSGSTGRPKGVAISHRSAAAFVDAEALILTLSPEDRVLAGLSVAFDASCEEMWLAWRNGAALVPAARELVRSGTDLAGWLARRRVSVVSTVPTLAAAWEEADLAGVRLLILGGEACPEPLAWRLAAGREVWNTYGPTEATVVSTAARIRPGEPVGIGWPLRGWEVAVVDEREEPVALGEAGQLVISGVGLGRYLDPALDAERYAPLPALGWERAYRTGDVVREDVDGLRFVGRRDDQVKIAGRRIELGEVEAQLRAQPGVRAAAAAVQRTAAGNSMLVGYVVGDADPLRVRKAVGERLAHGVAPLVVALDALPLTAAGKLDRKALPWPPPADGHAASGGELEGTAAWLAERWEEQLGPLGFSSESDFFELGGSSLAAAKLVSRLRRRYPAVAVADVYNHRRLGELARRLDSLAARPSAAVPAGPPPARLWPAAQLLALFALVACSAPQWLLGILALSQLDHGILGPRVGWPALIALWLLFGNVPGRAVVLMGVKRLLLPRGIRPGRYPRHGWLALRLWFLERLADGFRSESLAGTPFAARWARLCGHDVGPGAQLGTIPPVTSLVSIGAGATLESDVDMHGWWLEGPELVIGAVRVGVGARVGTRALLAPGASVGEGAEIEPASVVHGTVPAGQRWAGVPAAPVGRAGESWPAAPAPEPSHPRFWRHMYLVGLAVLTGLPLLAALPALGLLLAAGGGASTGALLHTLLILAPASAASFLLAYALLTAALARGVGRLVRPGLHANDGRVGFAVWFTEAVMSEARGVLFSLYSSIYTRAWLRLAGIAVGERAEISTVVGANRLTSFAPRSFVTDDVVMAGARSRNGWLHVGEIEVGEGSFLGNGAILSPDSRIGRGALVGVLTTAPREVPPGTSWFGVPALELPRVPDRVAPERSTDPPARLIAARGAMDLIRILLPATLSVVLGVGVLWSVVQIGRRVSALAMVLSTPLVLLAAGVVATALTVAAKWLIIGRYRPGEHPLWSFFIWRDEVLNSLQDQLAGTWLLGAALGTPLMSVYLRAMGAKVGRDVWCETLTITEFDCVELGDGCVINRFACVETHLFHDRLMRIGPTAIGPGATLGPSCALLPDTRVGAGVRVGGRSVVMRGEELSDGTSWHGAPVVAA